MPAEGGDMEDTGTGQQVYGKAFSIILCHHPVPFRPFPLSFLPTSFYTLTFRYVAFSAVSLCVLVARLDICYLI